MAKIPHQKTLRVGGLNGIFLFFYFFLFDQPVVGWFLFSTIEYLNGIEQWLQNKRPFLNCKLFNNEMNFLKKNLYFNFQQQLLIFHKYCQMSPLRLLAESNRFYLSSFVSSSLFLSDCYCSDCSDEWGCSPFLLLWLPWRELTIWLQKNKWPRRD